jgi:RimJ/RimL family protein N-acetyltransferase
MTVNPVLTDVPMPIRTPRLVLVPPLPEYTTQFYESKTRSIPHLNPWMIFADRIGTHDDEKEFLTKKYAEFILRETLMMLVFTHDDKFVGATGLHNIDWRIPRADIGYWCDIEATGHGYITEIANALIRYGFDALGMRKISIAVDSENTRSEAVALRLNMIKESESKGAIVTLHKGDDLRTRVEYCCFDTASLPKLDVTW